jgi:aerobic-type carbon monoxide dehydrogenase small subunit (CoxS/CutS family)
VLVDGEARLSCQTRVADVVGHAVTTIEGLARGDELHPLQKAFIELDAMQCGYCTPGMILGAVGLLKHNPDPSDAEVAEALEGHICRCGAYQRIVAATRHAAAATRGVQ